MFDSSVAITRVETCSAAMARRVAAMLDLPPDGLVDGAPLPRGWQFVLLAADTQRAALRADGFPGLGVPMPDLGLPRLLLGGRSVAYHADIAIGAPVWRTSAMQSLTEKTTDNGKMAIATIAHELRAQPDASPAIVETQTYMLLPARQGAVDDAGRQAATPGSGSHTKLVVPDDTLLFQYSALCFNSHKIHLDRRYAREVEGFPDLVVNGGLSTLLLTEFLRRELAVTPSAIKVRHLLPLFCGRPMTLAADVVDERWQLRAFNEQGHPAISMEVGTR
jgi:3-methylfumaryl-CoA hydratase